MDSIIKQLKDLPNRVKAGTVYKVRGPLENQGMKEAHAVYEYDPRYKSDNRSGWIRMCTIDEKEKDRMVKDRKINYI